MEDMDFFDWYEFGLSKNWISEITCAVHDGVPMTEDESLLWDEGNDPCQFILRIWED